jgi:DNA-binding LacI/PurR family transcriptional regulator
MGRRAFEYAARVLDGARPAREVLPTQLVLRESTGPAPR